MQKTQHTYLLTTTSVEYGRMSLRFLVSINISYTTKRTPVSRSSWFLVANRRYLMHLHPATVSNTKKKKLLYTNDAPTFLAWKKTFFFLFFFIYFFLFTLRADSWNKIVSCLSCATIRFVCPNIACCFDVEAAFFLNKCVASFSLPITLAEPKGECVRYLLQPSTGRAFPCASKQVLVALQYIYVSIYKDHSAQKIFLNFLSFLAFTLEEEKKKERKAPISQ